MYIPIITAYIKETKAIKECPEWNAALWYNGELVLYNGQLKIARGHELYPMPNLQKEIQVYNVNQSKQ